MTEQKFNVFWGNTFSTSSVKNLDISIDPSELSSSVSVADLEPLNPNIFSTVCFNRDASFDDDCFHSAIIRVLLELINALGD